MINTGTDRSESKVQKQKKIKQINKINKGGIKSKVTKFGVKLGVFCKIKVIN